MNKNKIILFLKKKLENIETEIKICKDIIKNTNTPLRMKQEKEIEKLELEKEKILKAINKFEEGEDTIIDSLKISIENMINDLNEKIKKLSLKSKIQIDDSNLARETLERNNKSLSDYDINIEIEKLKDKEKKHVATRLIIITNKKTGNVKKYPASMSKEHLWNIEFEKDLKNGFFEKKRIRES